MTHQKPREGATIVRDVLARACHRLAQEFNVQGTDQRQEVCQHFLQQGAFLAPGSLVVVALDWLLGPMEARAESSEESMLKASRLLSRRAREGMTT